MSKSKRKGVIMSLVDVSDRANGTTPVAPVATPFPAPVAARLAIYQRELQSLIDAQQAYIAGVLDVLGIDRFARMVSVDLTAYTYTVADRADA